MKKEFPSEFEEEIPKALQKCVFTMKETWFSIFNAHKKSGKDIRPLLDGLFTVGFFQGMSASDILCFLVEPMWQVERQHFLRLLFERGPPDSFNLTECLSEIQKNDLVLKEFCEAARHSCCKAKTHKTIAKFLTPALLQTKIELLYNALREDPDDSEVLLSLADIYQQRNQPERAKRFTERALGNIRI